VNLPASQSLLLCIAELLECLLSSAGKASHCSVIAHHTSARKYLSNFVLVPKIMQYQ